MRDSPQIPAHAHTPAPAAPDLRRRRFLLAVSAGGAGAVAATTPARAAVVTTPASDAAETSTGYRETGHVKSYYATTRL